MTTRDYLQQIENVIEQGPYQDSWQSLASHPVPQWYCRDKFGIFIHWGIYSVPAYGNEWYSRNMYDSGHREFQHHIATYGHHKDFGYKDFIPMFRGEHFDAAKWVAQFRQAGARFVVPVAEHHDGFAMYDTAFNPYNSTKMGPQMDYVGRLQDACREQGLRLCASTHRAEHYFFMNMGRTFESDVGDPAWEEFYGPAVYCPEFSEENLGKTTEDPYALGASREWLEDWLVRTCELIDRYQPKLLYFDWWIQNHSFKPYLKKLAAYYYNRAVQWGEDVVITYKHEAFAPGVGIFDVERGALTEASPVPWQTDTAIGKQSWGYRADNEYKSARQVICDLVDVVSKNGTLLLNIGPKSDGTFTQEETQVLQDLGDWLRQNGEGIYGTRPWKWCREGEVNNAAGFFRDGDEKPFTGKDFRFTYKDGFLYAFQMRPDGERVTIQTLARKPLQDLLIQSVQSLSTGKPLKFHRDEAGLHIQLTDQPENDLPLGFRIELA